KKPRAHETRPRLRSVNRSKQSAYRLGVARLPKVARQAIREPVERPLGAVPADPRGRVHVELGLLPAIGEGGRRLAAGGAEPRDSGSAAAAAAAEVEFGVAAVVSVGGVRRLRLIDGDVEHASPASDELARLPELGLQILAERLDEIVRIPGRDV